MAEPHGRPRGRYDPRDDPSVETRVRWGIHPDQAPRAGGGVLPEPVPPDIRLALNRMGSFDWDLDNGTFDLDAAGLEVFDLRPDEYDGVPTSLLVRVPSAEGYRIDAAVAEALREGLSSYGAYFRLRCRDGSRRWTHTQGHILRDEVGHAYRVIGIVRDARGELSHSPAIRTLDEDRRRQTMMVQRTTAALSRALTTEDVAQLLTAAGTLERFGAGGLALGLIQGERLKVIGLTGGPVDDLDEILNSRVDDDLPMSWAAFNGRPRFMQSRDQLRRTYPRVAPYLEPFDIGSAAFLPLIAQARPIGSLGLFFRDAQEFSAEDRNLYLALAGAVAQSVQRALLFDQEHEFAAGLQSTMLPRRIPETPGGDVAVRYRAVGTGRDVGGDWYDVITLPQGRIGAVVGDVQGHDTHAAAVMGQLRVALRAYAAEGHPPGTVLSRASRFLADLDTDRFATCTYLQVDLDSGAAHMARAGHLGPLLSDGRGSVRWPGVRGGLPLGLATAFDLQEYPETQLQIDPGATVVMCTDGLVEQPGRDIQDGIEALSEAVREGPRQVDELADHLSALLWERPRAKDDMAVLVLRRAMVSGVSTLPRFHQHIHQADPEGLVEVRAAVRQVLEGWRAGDVAYDVQLVADELATNALIHTDGGALLGLELLPGRPRRVRLEVQDRSSAWPHRRSPGEAATSGRGLLMVEELTCSWGVEPRGSGKAVWCEFRLPPPLRSNGRRRGPARH